MLHSAAAVRSSAAPVVWSRRNASSAAPRSNRRVDDRERDREVGAGAHRQVQVREPRQLRLPRIDHHERGALRPCLLDERHEVDAGGRRVGAPDDDEARLFVVLVADAGHLPVHRLARGARGGGAQGARHARRAEPAEHLRVERVLRQVAVRAAVVEGLDRLAAPRRLRASRSPARCVRSLRPRAPGRTGRAPWGRCGPAGA